MINGFYILPDSFIESFVLTNVLNIEGNTIFLNKNTEDISEDKARVIRMNFLLILKQASVFLSDILKVRFGQIIQRFLKPKVTNNF